MIRVMLLCVALVAAAVVPAGAVDYVREELRIPMSAAGPRGLEALLVRPAGAGRYPLALISHGSAHDAKGRRDLTPYLLYRPAIEFARRGFAALVVLRRGYGDSGGGDASLCCEPATFLELARASAEDLKAAITAMKNRPDVNTARMLAVGVSAGGLATIALTASPPAGLVAAINFAGGLRRHDRSTDEPPLVETFRSFGATSRIPTLWIYAANDSYFGAELTHRLFEAFTGAGGRARLIDAPAFGNDGHDLFPRGSAVWPPMIGDFLHEQKLGLDEPLAGPILADLPPAPPLTPRGRTAFSEYLAEGIHKAFAISTTGGYGYATASRTAEEAEKRALDACVQHASECQLYAVDDVLQEKIVH